MRSTGLAISGRDIVPDISVAEFNGARNRASSASESMFKRGSIEIALDIVNEAESESRLDFLSVARIPGIVGIGFSRGGSSNGVNPEASDCCSIHSAMTFFTLSEGFLKRKPTSFFDAPSHTRSPIRSASSPEP